MTDEQFNAIKDSVRLAFSYMSSEDIKAIIKEPYQEFKETK